MPFVDLCTACAAARKQREQEDGRRHGQELLDQINADQRTIDGIKAAIAATAERLRDAGSPGLSTQREVSPAKHSLLGFVREDAVRVHGWKVGSFDWNWIDADPDSSSGGWPRSGARTTWVLSDGTVAVDPWGGSGSLKTSVVQWHAIERAFVRIADQLVRPR
ncbi:hypothetical protein [Streptacidiphilus sp. P02-A3a]|uniref:hypothetical protein n=1 Tax=Streptacidiphilus sp. P02-A3a TaxID=2704468 RepID=UPI0015FBCAA1|nr:hypothetical protein [Streptacidiphilus sp. P02-A3a]QMU73210.1 hypothetical protein GXP74_38245 [Streptacidiphilus sp. P02-A3a]